MHRHNLKSGKTISLDVNRYDTIEKVKQKITNRKENESIPSRYFHLTYCSKYLKDRYKLCNYKIKKESTIHLKLRINNSSATNKTLVSAVAPSASSLSIASTKGLKDDEIMIPMIKRSKLVSDVYGCDKLKSPYKRKAISTSASASNKKLKKTQYFNLHQPLTRKSQNYYNQEKLITNESAILEKTITSDYASGWDSLFLLLRQCINIQEHLEKEIYKFLFTHTAQRNSHIHVKLFLNLLNTASSMLSNIKDAMEIVHNTTDHNIFTLKSIMLKDTAQELEMDLVSHNKEGWNTLFCHMTNCNDIIQHHLHRKVYDFILTNMEHSRNPIPNKLFCNLVKSCICRLNSMKHSIEIATSETGSFSIDFGMINLSV